MGRHQRGYIYEAFGAFHVRYYTTEIVEGQTVRKQRSHPLCTKDRATGDGSPSAKAVRDACQEIMRSINQHHKNSNFLVKDMMLVSFGYRIYRPYYTKI